MLPTAGIKNQRKIIIQNREKCCPTRIEIFSPTGTSLKKHNVAAGTTQVAIHDLPAGVYIVAVYQKDLIASVHKFIKQ